MVTKSLRWLLEAYYFQPNFVPPKRQLALRAGIRPILPWCFRSEETGLTMQEGFSTLRLHLKRLMLIGIPPLPARLPVLPPQLLSSLTALSTSQAATICVSYQTERRTRDRLTHIPEHLTWGAPKPALFPFIFLPLFSVSNAINQIWIEIYSDIVSASFQPSFTRSFGSLFSKTYF